MLAAAAAEEAAAAAALGVRRVGAVDDLRCLDENLDSLGRRWVGLSSQSPTFLDCLRISLCMVRTQPDVAVVLCPDMLPQAQFD